MGAFICKALEVLGGGWVAALDFMREEEAFGRGWVLDFLAWRN